MALFQSESQKLPRASTFLINFIYSNGAYNKYIFEIGQRNLETRLFWLPIHILTKGIFI